jgi:hypothetical protein
MDEDRGGYGATATIASAVGGVEVLDNTALSDGGGVFVSGAIWEQTGTGSFVGGDDTSMPNRAERGGGIFVEGFGKVLLGDPDDSSDWVGLNPPDGFPIDGAQVRYNAATKAGGGLYVNGTGGVFGSGAAIFHNKAMGAGSGDGGGLAVWGALGWVELHSSVVSRNRARI